MERPGKRDLITIEDLSNQEIEEIFDLADRIAENRYDRDLLSGKIMATLFYEPSTRTRLSFEAAMQRLGGSVISCPDMKVSSAAKGESVADTARVVSSYADILVVRHFWDGAVRAMAEHAWVPVVNAGDGSHEHPTQTLCDLYTLRKEKGRLQGLTVVICGDLKHGRTIHSLIYGLARFGVNVVTLAASGLELPAYVVEKLGRDYRYSLAPISSSDLQAVVKDTDAVYLGPDRPHQLALFTQIDTEIQDRMRKMASHLRFDAFYVTRRQKERVKDGNAGSDDGYPKIGQGFLRGKRFRETVVMHPLPRVDELSYELDQDRRGIYFKQAAYGVPVRMALLRFLFDAAGKRETLSSTSGPLLYENPEPVGLQCPNANCVTRAEPVSARPRFEPLFGGPGGALVLSCVYCDHRFRAQCIGHTRSRRYCSYDRALEETARGWLKRGELAIFDSIKQAEELGYDPYRSGPLRIIMDEAEIREAVSLMGEKILRESGDGDRLLVLGIRTKGSVLAQRLARELERVGGRRIELGEIEIYGAGEGLRRLSPPEGDRASLGVTDRSVILVDDVIHTGRTIKSALSIIFKAGRPKSVRLAVLVDRGHREVPIKPDYVGKHMPSSDRERVRVKLREVEQDERDKVVIYSMLGPADSDQLPEISAEK